MTKLLNSNPLFPMYSVDMFHWNLDDKEFSQEASTLRIPAGMIPKVIVLKNPKTGGTLTFDYSGVIENGEEIGGWNYHSYSTIGRLELIIWND